jgi:phosphate transport system substrate-binding protein
VIARAIAILAVCGLSTAWADLVVPRDAPYLLADGAIHVVGDRTLEPLLSRWNDLFAKAHPRIRFTLHLGNPPVGLDGVIARVSIFAPIAHDAWESEIDPFKRLNGYLPLDVRVGRIGYAEPARENPPAIYVNAANPLRQLTIDEVGRIFTAGRPPGDLRHWSQLGIAEEWARHSIHVYGTRDDGTYVTALRIARFGGQPFARHYEALASDAEVLQALAGDRYGIGLAAAIDARLVPASVKLVPLSVAAGASASTGEYEEVRLGRYPLSPYLHIYLDRVPGRAMDPVAKEYLKLALSPQGQHIIEELKPGQAGFVPLTAEEAARELAKID